MNELKPIAWSVSGADCGSGAGIAADLRAFDALGVHGCTVIAALTAQNSLAVDRIEPVATNMLEAQLAALARDMPPRAIKTGMLGSRENLECLARWVDKLRETNPKLALVVDPVLRASTGADLVDDALLQAYRQILIPRASLITPNRREAAALLGWEPLRNASEVERAAAALQALGCQAVVITGGDESSELSQDYALTPHAQGWLSLPRVDTSNNHGTGCVFASSACTSMAIGFVAMESIVIAKMATTQALRLGYAVGQGSGPVLPAGDFAQRIENLPVFVPSPSTGGEQNRGPLLLKSDLGLYAIVDSSTWIERVVAAGVRTVQLRTKSTDANHIRHEIKKSIASANKAGAKLFINDHWKIAIEEGAYGVHLGQEDLQTADLEAIKKAGVRLGLSTHCYWEVCRAWALQPSYIACGPIHETFAKDMPWIPQGNDNLAYWCALLPIPVVAIGGMNVERTEQAARCGAAGVAVISAITGAADPEQAIANLQAAVMRGKANLAGVAPTLLRPTLS